MPDVTADTCSTLPPRVATGGKTLEELTDADFATSGIVPVSKVLVHDLLSDDYHLGKVEVLAVHQGARPLASY